MLLANACPKRVKRLVINDVGPEASPAGILSIAKWVGQAPTEFDKLDKVTGYHREHFAPLASASAETIAKWTKAGSIRPTVRGTLMWKLDPSLRVELLRSRDISGFPTRVLQPTVIIRGSESSLLSERTVARLCRLSRATRSVKVPGVGHAAFARAASLDSLI